MASIRLTSAEILDFHANPKTVVTAPPGKVAWPLSFAAAYIAGATPYTDAGSNLGLYWDVLGAGLSLTTVGIVTAGFWDQATSQVQPDSPADIGGSNQAASDVAGKDLSVFCGGSDPTDGDGTLILTVSYILIDAA